MALYVQIIVHIMCDTLGKEKKMQIGGRVMRIDDVKDVQIIAVDFDGTLCGECYPQIGLPNLPLIALLKQLRMEGKRIILWTCRCGERLSDALVWCEGLGLQFDAVNENVPEVLAQYGMESRKISADIYIDDKSCFPWMCVQEQDSSLVTDGTCRQ